MKDQYFTAGEFAKLHHVNKRTLHYYDEIGLFQPNRKGENEYRYYSYQQSPEFELILAFRELGMSIEEIKAYYAERTPENFRRILQDKQHSIHEQIRHLRKIRQMLKVKEAQLNLCEQADFDAIAMIDCETEYLLLSDPMNGDFGSDDFKILFEQMVAAPAGPMPASLPRLPIQSTKRDYSGNPRDRICAHSAKGIGRKSPPHMSGCLPMQKSIV